MLHKTSLGNIIKYTKKVFNMKKVKNIVLLIFAFTSFASCKNLNKNNKLHTEKKETEYVSIEIDFAKKFPQKEIKIPKSFTLPVPKELKNENNKKTISHVSNISKEELTIIESVKDF
jgi:hypothetical protein